MWFLSILIFLCGQVPTPSCGIVTGFDPLRDFTGNADGSLIQISE
jgi:hypothetical protein